MHHMPFTLDLQCECGAASTDPRIHMISIIFTHSFLAFFSFQIVVFWWQMPNRKLFISFSVRTVSAKWLVSHVQRWCSGPAQPNFCTDQWHHNWLLAWLEMRWGRASKSISKSCIIGKMVSTNELIRSRHGRTHIHVAPCILCNVHAMPHWP